MDIQKILEEIQRTGHEDSRSQIGKIVYISDKSESTCQDCVKNNGKVFDIDDDSLPQLPVHSHCRCKYVSAMERDKDVSEDVERYRIVKNLRVATKLDEEKAKSLAAQIINARRENSKLREQRLFLLFNGRYLMSSDGELLLDAVSGKAVSEKVTVNGVAMWGTVHRTIEREFDYSYSRQGIENEGGIPWGLYHIEAKETRSIKNSPWSHGFKSNSWGDYSWTLHPDKDTDVRGRTGFFIHGGSDFNTKGCIDLQRGDTKFQKYFASTGLSSIYVYVKYEKEHVKTWE